MGRVLKFEKKTKKPVENPEPATAAPLPEQAAEALASLFTEDEIMQMLAQIEHEEPKDE